MLYPIATPLVKVILRTFRNNTVPAGIVVANADGLALEPSKLPAVIEAITHSVTKCTA